MAKFAMVIDLHKCVGCAACDIACKMENNLDADVHWSGHFTDTKGRFPNVRYQYVPTLCNHCEDAPCVKVCPTKAMFKNDDGIVLHNADKCIGCRSCQLACPYNVIYFNEEQQHETYRNGEALMPGLTATGKEIADKAKAPIPNYNPEREKTYQGIRQKGIVEKCTFCDHRVKEGKQPACVEACPPEARTFGDLDDPKSKVNQLLGNYTSVQLLKSKGTRPKVFYIRDF